MTVVRGMSVGRTAVNGGNPFIWKNGRKKAVWGRKLLEKKMHFFEGQKKWNEKE